MNIINAAPFDKLVSLINSLSDEKNIKAAVFLFLAVVLTGCGTGPAEDALSSGQEGNITALTGAGISAKGKTGADASLYNNGNSTNYYAVYDGDGGKSDTAGEITVKEGILQFGRDKKLKNCISVPGIATPITIIEKVTESAVYFTCEESEDLDAGVILYKIPLEKTEGDDRVCAERKEKLFVMPGPCWDDDILYLDDSRAVYTVYDVDDEGRIKGFQCLNYDMGTGKIAPVSFVSGDGAKVTELDNGIYIGDGIVATGEEMDSYCDRFFYYDIQSKTMKEAALPGMTYNGKLNYRIWGWATRDSIFYYPYESVGYPFGSGEYDLYRYDKETGEADVYLSGKQLRALLVEKGLWKEGMSPYVGDIMETGGRILLNVGIERKVGGKDKKISVRYALFSCDEESGENVAYEAVLTEAGRGKGVNKSSKSKYGEIVCEDCEPVFYSFPYIGYVSGELENEVYDMETGEWHTVKQGDAADWYSTLSVDCLDWY